MEEHDNQEKGVDDAIGKPLVSTVGSIQEAVRTLRGIFTELGLKPKEGPALARFEGEINGRFVTIGLGYRTRNRYATPSISRKHFEGLIITIAMKSSVKVTLQFLPTSYQWLMRLIQPWRGNKQVEALGPPYEDLSVWTHEVVWAKRYLEETAVQTALAPFILKEAKPDGQQTSGFLYTILNSVAPTLYPSSKAASYTIAFGYDTCTLVISNPPAPFTLEAFQQWINQLDQVVSLTEKYPPTQEATLSWLGKQSEQVQIMAVVASLIFIPVAFLAFCGIACFVLALVATSAFQG